MTGAIPEYDREIIYFFLKGFPGAGVTWAEMGRRAVTLGASEIWVVHTYIN